MTIDFKTQTKKAREANFRKIKIKQVIDCPKNKLKLKEYRKKSRAYEFINKIRKKQDYGFVYKTNKKSWMAVY